MYVTTFYSFKGGVGRTMALVNVAVDLAQRGRRVLAVDFDLEAPGIDTFDLRRPTATTPGVIDFVSAYLQSGQSPHVGEFVFESPGIGDGNGGLWVMPAGAHQDSYASTFAQIDWGALYEQHDGYLLFEDLKEQWKTFVNPDYVLIDSRTGHTDIGGICTRQLPHSVVILFFPNAQNLRGLKKVVHDIRGETRHPRNNAIDLHFVMSNVPDLDDEDKILEANIASFQRDLGFQGDPMLIHRYDSLLLLNQAIFTKERPRSRLAKEYQSVTTEIIRLNAADRDGALDYIAKIQRIRQMPRGRPRAEAEKHLEMIGATHATDGEVLFHLGSLRIDDGNLGDAEALFTRAIDAGYREPDVYLRRAFIRRSERADTDGASQDAMEALSSDHASSGQVRRAMSMLTHQDLTRVADSPAVAALPLSEQVWIASGLTKSESEAETASTILRRVLASGHLLSDEQTNARRSMSLAAIALRRFSEALELIRSEAPEVSRMNIDLAFNYGMALWGEKGQLVLEPFQHVVEIERSEPQEDHGPNYLQCMAVSHWAVGEPAAAQNFAAKAKQVMARQHGQEFSCWRYLRVDSSQFEEDTNEILKLIGGDENMTPHFMNSDT